MMTTTVAVYLCVLAAGMIVLMLRQHVNGTCDLISIRNVAILGFILFQLTSPAISLFSGDYGPYYIAYPGWAGLQFAAMASVFLVVALWSYRHGWGATQLAQLVPTTWAVPKQGTLLFLSIVVTVLAAALRFGVQIPLIGVVANHVGTALAAVASGLIAWVLGRRLLNPLLIGICVLIVGANLGIVMFGGFGRRGLVAVGAAVIWGMYYSHWRYLPTRAILSRLALVSIPPVLFVALYSSVRQSAEHERSVIQHLQEMTAHGEFRQGLLKLVVGQNVGSGSIWLIEAYPESFDYRHLMTLRYFLFYPVPRAWWPGKPAGLGQLIASQALIPYVDRSALNIGPGIIGTAAAEGGWYALLIYAVCGGLYLRFFDQIVVLNRPIPFVVLPVGAALGEVLGLARGGVASFAFITVMAVGGSLLFMVTIGKLVERTMSGNGGAPDDQTTADYDNVEP